MLWIFLKKFSFIIFYKGDSSFAEDEIRLLHLLQILPLTLIFQIANDYSFENRSLQDRNPK